jgi:hypothetical protein
MDEETPQHEFFEDEILQMKKCFDTLKAPGKDFISIVKLH